MSTPYIGQIMVYPYNFAPNGWAFCDGQLLSIAQNTALFSLLGTTYGGNGQTNFGLPDLRGRVALSAGQGPGLQNYVLGQLAGSETVTLVSTQMPAHTHPVAIGSLGAKLRARNAAGNSRTPVGTVPAIESAGVTATYSSASADSDRATGVNGALAISGTPTVAINGNSQPHGNQQPFLTLHYCIALNGIFPSRN